MSRSLLSALRKNAARAGRKTAVSAVVFFSLVGCSSPTVLRDKDYHDSLRAFRSGDPEAALQQFPKGERGGFITSVEKSWLGLWDKPSGLEQAQALAKQSRTFDERKFTSVTREAEIFLVQESEEGYVPSEDEVVVLHVVAALAFMQLNRWEDAEVEARRAGFYLQNPFNENQPHFDDPALRLWLAGIWAALGDWNAAQVDLRVAARLSKNKKLEALANGPAPKELNLIFSGIAPSLKWSDASAAPEFTDESTPPARKQAQSYIASVSTLSWYAHHTERNTALRDVLLKSNYMSQYLALKASNALVRTGGRSAAILLGTVGVVAGIAIIAGGIYVMAAAGGGGGELVSFIVGAGGVVALTSYNHALALDREVQDSVDKNDQRTLEDMRSYRVVRFLPAWVTVESSIPPPTAKLNLFDRSRFFEARAPRSVTRVRYTHEF